MRLLGKVRNREGLRRLMVILVLGGCSAAVGMWTWSFGTSFQIKRSVLVFDTELLEGFAQMEVAVEEEPVICPPCNPDPLPSPPWPLPADLHAINCSIDGAEMIDCKEEGGEVYMPVTFINKYFDVYGDKRGKRGHEYYDFRYSYGYVCPPEPVYHPGGVFLHFHKYNVARRSLILCVSASDGVPVTSQWDPNGYYYAITIAQYGFSHHAKGLMNGNPEPKLLANGDNNLSAWEIPTGSSLVQSEEQTVNGVNKVLAFSAPALPLGIRYNAPSQYAQIVSVTLHGHGFLDNVTIAKTAHNDHLIHEADWMVRNQDAAGGWPTMIPMKTRDIQLEPGWYSAMGQGQAMSTLVRAYNVTGKKHYLDTAVKALHLFTLGSEEGGVRARFFGQLDWYEEYPTTPTSTFVLNGFIFSLLGLYDVMKTVEGKGQELAEKLWKSGLHSLKSMLGMYDSGTGTFYNLRHVMTHAQPNRARWDYHTLHIALIQEMAIIDGDDIFNSTAERWTGYLYGKVSKHN